MYGMIVRYAFPGLAPDWAGEVTVFLIVWATLIGGSSLAAQGRHVRADIVLRLLASPTQTAAEAFNLVIAALFCAVMAVSGWLVVEFALMLDERSLDSLQIPLAWYYLRRSEERRVGN